MTINNETSSTTTINASPTKNFFVEMLTRDIELEDAILDLLDNCVDGIQRTNKENVSLDKPYEHFWAQISFSETGFEIEDNCGGISIDIAKGSAFRMGSPKDAGSKDKDVYTIGTYGIGMKRAIFKMGRSSRIVSQTKNDAFEVEITPQWLGSDDSWDLPFQEIERLLPDNGTKIKVTDLREGISREFKLSDHSTLHNSLTGKISNYYNYILNKGFTVLVNGVKVPITPLTLLWEGKENITDKNAVAIAPYLYRGQIAGVEVDLAVGFYRSTPTEEEVDEETKGSRRSSDTAGWTIVCNDRVVVYCDKTRLTGWGEATVPSYHPQFIAVSGIVHFRSKDARSLPITTTKRGIDSSSDVYLYVKDFMREGLKLFTSYTNKWKKDSSEEKARSSKAQPTSPREIFDEVPTSAWTQVRRKTGGSTSATDVGKKYFPKLPSPEASEHTAITKRISFSKPVREVEIVADYLFEDSDRDPSEVAEACFNKVLREAEK